MTHGNKGKIKIYNKKLDDERTIKKEELQDYLNIGYIKGRRPFSEEHKRKIGEALKDIKRGPFSEEHKRKIGEGNKDKKLSEETKQKLRETFTEERRQKIRETNTKNKKDKKLSKEHKKHLGEANTGKKRSKEQRKNISEGKIGILFSEEHKRNQRIAAIKRIEKNIKNGGQITPGYNLDACKYFDLLMKETNTYIQHAKNGGEFSILGYYVDGYDKENNIVYEYDESFHYKDGTLREKDIQRQKEITEHLNCKFIRIKEKIIK